MPFAYGDLDWADGSNNDGGLANYVYYAPLSHVNTFPTVPASPTTNADVVTIADDFVMETGKKFLKVYCTRDMGELTSKMVGETDSKSYENKVDLFIPGNEAEIAAFLEKIKNTNAVWLVPDREGKVRVLGSENLPAKIEVGETTSGKKAGDARGTKMTISSVGRIAPFYTGDIPLTPAA